jgi:3-hydroxybutyryl-CoA dehydrogenase
MKIQLLTDAKYRSSFENYLAASHELVSDKPEIVVDAMFLDIDKKLVALASVGDVPIISNTLTMATTTIAARMAAPRKVIGMPMLPNHFTNQKSVEYSLPLGATHPADSAINFLSALSKTGEQIQDCIGGVFPRTLAMIVDEAAFAVQESVATPADIDVAMKLGTNYPKGPLAWCDEIGASVFVAILDALAREYGPERYRVATLLRRNAEAGTKFIV